MYIWMDIALPCLLFHFNILSLSTQIHPSGCCLLLEVEVYKYNMCITGVPLGWLASKEFCLIDLTPDLLPEPTSSGQYYQITLLTGTDSCAVVN